MKGFSGIHKLSQTFHGFIRSRPDSSRFFKSTPTFHQTSRELVFSTEQHLTIQYCLLGPQEGCLVVAESPNDFNQPSRGHRRIDASTSGRWSSMPFTGLNLIIRTFSTPFIRFRRVPISSAPLNISTVSRQTLHKAETREIPKTPSPKFPLSQFPKPCFFFFISISLANSKLHFFFSQAWKSNSLFSFCAVNHRSRTKLRSLLETARIWRLRMAKKSRFRCFPRSRSHLIERRFGLNRTLRLFPRIVSADSSSGLHGCLRHMISFHSQYTEYICKILFPFSV